MKVIITLDYELFFGKKCGSFNNSILEPAKELLKISDAYGLKYTIFVDAGYINKLREYKNVLSCEKEYNANKSLLEKMIKKGHNIELHVHPHWENTKNINGDWNFDLTKYRMHDFTDEKKAIIFEKYLTTINEITGKKVCAVRFGGWCIQPFETLSDIMKNNGIKIDSSVFVGGYDKSNTHYYDFTLSPKKTYWNFEKDPIKEQKEGFFTEIPISSTYLLPSFYIKYLLNKFMKNKQHLKIGDGIPLQKSKIKRMNLLLRGGVSVISTDGLFSSKLNRSFKKHKLSYNEKEYFVTIGHLKSCTKFSIKALKEFIKYNIDDNEFTTYASHTK